MDVIRKTNLSRHKSHSFITWLNTYCASEIRDILELKDSSYVPGPFQYLGNAENKIAQPYILKCNTETGFIEASAHLILHKLSDKLNESHNSIALIGFSGGSTPLKIFQFLCTLDNSFIDPNRIYVFIVDERYTQNLCDSNCELVRSTLIKHWQIPETNIIFPNLNLPLDQCVIDYEQRLSKILNITTPHFVTLGLGNDFHIAGLFPEYIKNFTIDQLAGDAAPLVIKTETNTFTCRQRITVTLRVLASAKTKLFFIKGEEKYNCWKEMINSGININKYPATHLFTQSDSICVLDGSNFKHQTIYSYSPKDFLSVVIFGPNGDLSRRRLFPALFHLFYCGLLPENFKIICATRSRIDFDDFFFIISNDIFTSILTNIYMCNPATRFDFPTCLNAFKQHCTLVKLVYDGSHISKLQLALEELEKGYSAKRLFYLATPSNAYKPILDLIRKIPTIGNHCNRIMLEKPFGRNLSTCLELKDLIEQIGGEEDNFLVDHYIGKAVLKFILSVRTCNDYMHLFSNKYVKNIHIELLEELCVANRPYFENYGIIRDMLQNHAMILLSYLTMSLECNAHDNNNSTMDINGEDNNNSTDINGEKDKFYFNHNFPFHHKRLELLKKVATISLDDAVVGQYVRDSDMPGFKDTMLDQSNSNCPTYATIKLSINDPLWADVPIVLTSGKALDRRIGRITITFKQSEEISISKLIFQIHPKPMAYWIDRFESSKAELHAAFSKDDMIRDSKCLDGSINQISLPGVAYEGLMKPIAGAYENVFLQAIWGYKHLFPKIDEVVECWRIFDNLLAQMETIGICPFEYVRGSRGPAERELIHKYLK